MNKAFDFVDGVTELGDYCRACLDVDDERTYPPSIANNTWEIYKCLYLTNELLELFDRIHIFHQLAQAGYKIREQPHLIKWHYSGNNRGAADHYHHDGHFGKSGQFSLMLLLEQNIGMTHMRIVTDSRQYLGRKIYDLLWRLPFRGRGRLLRLNDWLIELVNPIYRLEGPRDRLYFFNAGDNLHKAFPVNNTTRTIFHLNFTLFESNVNLKNVVHLKSCSLSPDLVRLLGG